MTSTFYTRTASAERLRKEDMSQVNMAVKLQVQKASANATILAIITAVGGLAVSLGLIGVNQQGIISAATVAALSAAAVIANAIHTGNIEPSAITTAVIAVVGQAVSLLVSFALIDNTEAGTVIAIATAAIGAAAMIAHALLSKKVA
jgi:hypothetical protein